ncbi:MAG: hypothetical protein CSA66_04255 [Proteobacteria bacterium]|nr:MAG: hypothetical protein CSA66_04255 [Pseudomonadota bacterium]
MTRWARGLGSWVGALALAAVVGACVQRVAPPPATAERVVHHEQDGRYGIWVIDRADGVRVLRFERHGVDQTAVRLGDPGHLEFSYTRALLAAFALAPRRARVLVVGLGGGTIPMFLRHVEPGVRVDAVEIDPVVVRVAKDYLGFVEDEAVRVHVGDGRRHLAEAQARWDVVVLDAYGPDAIPEHLATREFLELVRARLAPGGLVVANVWSERFNRAYLSMLRTYEAVFPEVRVVRGRGSGSRLVMAAAAPTGVDEAALVARSQALGRQWGLAFDLARIVREGHQAPGGLPVGGTVLRDR